MIAKAVNDDVGVNPSEELARKFAPAVDPQNVPGKAPEVPKITMIDRPEDRSMPRHQKLQRTRN